MNDLIIINADIITMSPAMPKASAVVVKEGKIRHVGDDSSVKAFTGVHARVLDLKGKTLCPGFVDAHLHFRAMAESFTDMDLKPHAGIHSIEDIKDRILVAAQNTPADEWIRGAGYHETTLEEQRHPDRRDLDAVTMRHPIKLTHRSGYAHVLNSRALENVGIFRHTPDPDGGIIDRDLNSGDPTGILYNMGNYLNQRMPPIDEKTLQRGVKQADLKLLSCGVTAFQDASFRNNKERLDWFCGLKQRGEPASAIGFITGFDAFKRDGEISFSPGKARGIFPGGVKIIVDETTGRVLPDQKQLNERVGRIHESGNQAVIHAVEVAAIRAAVSAVGNALKLHPKADHRHRIEHCSVCPPDLIDRIAALGIWVVTHPAFVYYNGDRYLKSVALEDQPFLYPIASLKKSHVRVCASSDAPMVSPDPVAGLYGGVSRMTATGNELLQKEGVTVYDALDMYTRSAAEAGFMEQSKGTIATGKDGDFVVLSENPFDVGTAGIKDIRVLMTVIGGEIVWRKQ